MLLTRYLVPLLVSAFTCAIFYGDLYLGFTIPAALLILPLVVGGRALARIDGPRSGWRLPAGLACLALLFACIGVQTLLGHGPRGRTDLTVYLPLVYAAATVAALSGVRVSDRLLHRTLIGGGALAGVVLIATLVFAAPGSYALPGQDPVVAQRRHEETRALLRQESRSQTRPATVPGGAQPGAKPGGAATTPPSDVAADIPTPEPEVTGLVKVYYRLKNMARTPLGMSNFLALIFVILFNVMLYQRSGWSALFALLTVLTVSRSGIGFLLLSVAVWYAQRRGRLRLLVTCAAAAVAIGGLVLIVFWGQITALSGFESLGARFWYLGNAFDPIAAHPLFGAPRSEIMRLFGYPITWTPHVSVLHVWVLFGLAGVIAYSGYMAMVLRAFARRARSSDFWRGVTAAAAIALVWSTIEIIVLTPAFEMLVAALYGIAQRAPDPERERI